MLCPDENDLDHGLHPRRTHPAAKAKARDWFREGALSDWNGEASIEDAKAAFVLIGWDVAEVAFSGFSSQGDGACFVGSWSAANVQPGKLTQHAPQDTTLHRIAAEVERIAAAFPFASFTVKHSGHYSHEHCTAFDVSIPNPDSDEINSPERDAAEAALVEAARDAMRWTYRALERDYEWESADEQVDETIRVNDYTFTAEGKRFG